MRVNRDLVGIICVTLMYFFLLSVDAIICYLELFRAKSYLHIILYNLLTLMVIWAHIKSSCTDPGLLTKNYKQLDSDLLPLNITQLIEKAIKNINSLSTNQILPSDFDSSFVVTDPTEEAIIQQLLKTCRECNALSPPNSRHCSICNG